MRDQAGQTTAEYTALLALVTAALAGGGAMAGLGGVATAVADGVRTGICIVAGDVCRASDAAAAGLSPCTVSERTRGEGLTFTVASLRLGADDGWTAARRSDGSVLITHAERREVGGSVGIGVEASPLGLELGVDGKLDYALGSGRAWEFPDAASAVRFLTAEDRDDVEPTWRYGDAGAVLAGGAGAGVAGVELAELESTAEAAAGVRAGRGLTTYYLRTRLDPLDGRAWVPGASARFDGPAARGAIVELTRDAAGVRELAFRTAGRGAREGQVVETVARLDLRVEANRAAAAPLLARRVPWPPAVMRELRALLLRAVRTGVVERAVYDVRDGSEELKLAAKLGLAFGVDGSEVKIDRRLVAASAWTNGSRERERADCGVTTAGLERTS
jgi:Flp pilus assembly pilin Flp